ncbi:MAG TPA: hypothetical protein VM165_25100, partial [Planctomycetaceae bacterium]|nr:hypothetical protein [Planctomycetaceae bacterium]
AAAVGAIGLGALLRTRNRDIAWSVLLIGSLLVSPLGWVYYGTMFGGPLLAVAQTASRRAQIVIAIGFAFLLVPPIMTASLGPLGILFFGSIYGWSYLLLFAGVVATTYRGPEPIDSDA